jgi:N-hydroxyarylamine O-acetyltransferase
MAAQFDLDAYVRRIGYGGTRKPSLALLAGIVAAHTATIPYENINVLLKRGVTLDAAALERKLVHGGRGGYCFEQNSLLAAALEALGSAVTRLAARVVRGLPTSATPGRGHKLLRIDLPDGVFLADVGFGHLTPTGPLALVTDAVQATPHEPCRLVSCGTELLLQTRLGDTWDSLFRFSLEAAPMVDFEMANWFASTFPTSPFRNHLIIARATEGGRKTIFNRRYTIRDRDSRATRRTLDGIDDYRDVLIGELGLALDESEVAAVVAEMAAHAPDEEVHRAFA